MASGWGRIAVGTRLEKQVDSRFVCVWSELITKGLRKGDGFLVASDLPAHRAANHLVRGFLKTPCDTLLMLDSDADVGPGFIEEFRNVEAGWDYDILQAFYTRRGWPPEAIWLQALGMGNGESDEPQLVQCLVTADNITTRVAAIGTHAVLIRREVFVGLLGDADPDKFEWFWYPRGEKQSEDVAFSLEARRAGFKLGATTSAKAGHISRVTTGWETYQEYLRLNGTEQKAIENAQEKGWHVEMH